MASFRIFWALRSRPWALPGLLLDKLKTHIGPGGSPNLMNLRLRLVPIRLRISKVRCHSSLELMLHKT